MQQRIVKSLTPLLPAVFTGSAKIGYGGKQTLNGSSISTSDVGTIPSALSISSPSKGDACNISDVYSCICNVINCYNKAAMMTSRWYYLNKNKKILASELSGYGLHSSVDNHVSSTDVSDDMRASRNDIIKAEHVNAAIS